MKMPIKLKPIKTAREYRKALALIEEYMDAKSKTTLADLVEVLSILVEKYEEEHFPIEVPDPTEAIKFRMEQMGFGTTELAEILGGRNRVSEILNHKRRLTLEMVKRLTTSWKIPAESLLGI